MMTLLSIHANFECEGCGTRFAVALDASYDGELFAHVRDTLMSGNMATDHAICSYIAEVVLCPTCTTKIDKARQDTTHPEGFRHRDQLTREWVLQHLGAML